jgi:hypothetical protein
MRVHLAIAHQYIRLVLEEAEVWVAALEQVAEPAEVLAEELEQGAELAWAMAAAPEGLEWARV